MSSNAPNRVDSMFDAMRKQAAIDLGRTDITAGSAADQCVVGLPLPSLSLRYLFQSNVYPLSRIAQIVGEEGCAKSSFLYEMFRWHMLAGGGAVLCENELKDSPDLRNSLLNWNPEWLQRNTIIKTHSMEEWQQALMNYIRLAQKYQDADNGPGRTIPIMYSVDSLMSTAPKEEIESVKKEGYVSRGFPLAANLISRYMRVIPDLIQTYPFSVAYTNHLKPGSDFMGRPVDNIPGGKSVKFMETYEIKMSRAPRCNIDKKEYEGLRIQLETKKNSLGPGRKKIVAELRWYRARDAEGQLKQYSYWAWNTATIEMLLGLAEVGGKKTTYNAIMDICDINLKGKTTKKIWSKALGIPDNAPVDYEEAGAILETRQDLMAQIHEHLGVIERPVFNPSVDYEEQKQIVARRGRPPKVQVVQEEVDLTTEEQASE